MRSLTSSILESSRHAHDEQGAQPRNLMQHFGMNLSTLFATALVKLSHPNLIAISGKHHAGRVPSASARVAVRCGRNGGIIRRNVASHRRIKKQERRRRRRRGSLMSSLKRPMDGFPFPFRLGAATPRLKRSIWRGPPLLLRALEVA